MTGVQTCALPIWNIFKIKYSGDKWSMEENKTYTFTGKVKKQDEYNEVKQTHLYYVGKVEEIEQA